MRSYPSGEEEWANKAIDKVLITYNTGDYRGCGGAGDARPIQCLQTRPKLDQSTDRPTHGIDLRNAELISK